MGYVESPNQDKSKHDGGQGGDTDKLQDEVLIAVMGSTGTGKSSFIRLMSGDTSVHIGESLESETSKIQVVRFVDPVSGRKVVLVDTPGFDDSRAGVTDTDILKEITQYLLDQYDDKRKLNGLIYVQRISDPRFGGQSGRNLRMFKGLCGSDNYKNVVVLTTFWDAIASEEEGIEREKQLQAKFFKELVKGGAQFMRHRHGSVDTGRIVLDHLFTLLPTNVRIQEEIRVEGKQLADTAAGSVHSQEIERLITKHKEEMTILQEEMKTIQAATAAEREAMKADLDKLRHQLTKQEQERLELRKGLDEAKESQEQLKQAVAQEEEMRKQDEQKHREALEQVQSQFDEEKMFRLVYEYDIREQRDRERKERLREKKEWENRVREERERESREREKQEQEIRERETRLREENKKWEEQRRLGKEMWEERLRKEKGEREEQLRIKREQWNERLRDDIKPPIEVQARS